MVPVLMLAFNPMNNFHCQLRTHPMLKISFTLMDTIFDCHHMHSILSLKGFLFPRLQMTKRVYFAVVNPRALPTTTSLTLGSTSQIAMFSRITI